ncbi:MAG: hypothetical protein M3R61_08235 [Chloroflexota bacterium]|nr:hypothetical protein [Chloroflexota bacterium]
MLGRLIANRSIQGLLVALVTLATVGNALAWQTVISGFAHPTRYGGEAESGNRTGSVEYSGSERRVRAGADNIAYTQAQINWNKSSGYSPAEVFHISPKNTGGGTCTAIRTVSGWNWTNLPSNTLTSKGCGIGNGYNGNELRFYYNPNGASTAVTYYIQSLYKDTGYNGTQGSKTTGEINLDSYAANWAGVRQYNDNHGKICINPDATYAPGASGC